MDTIICLSIFLWLFLLTAASIWVLGTKFWPARFQITYVPFLNNEVGSFLFAVVVLVIPVLGCCAGGSLLPEITSVFEMSEGGWVLLEKPPQQIKLLRAAEFHTIYAETIDGQLIACYHGSAYDTDCWRKISQIPDTIEYKCYNWIGDFPEPPSSVNVIDRIDVEGCITFAGMDDTNISSYVLSDEGDVYQKAQGDPSLIPPPGLIRMLCFLSMMGLIVGLLIVFGLMTVNKRQNTVNHT